MSRGAPGVPKKWTPKRVATAKAKFIELLAEMGSVIRVAKKMGVKRHLLYEWRDLDPAFKQAWETARDMSMDLLEDEAHRRGYEGVLRPVFQGGKKVGAVREYSDTLLMFLLNGGRPEKYKHRIDHTSANLPLRALTEQQLDDKLMKIIEGERLPMPPQPGTTDERPALPAPSGD